MTITAISRDLTNNPNLVHVESSTTLALASAASYISGQAANISALNNGTWAWQAEDVVMLKASDGSAMFSFSASDFATLVPLSVGSALPSHVVVYAGEVTTAGGDANESEAVTGVLATDLVFMQLHTVGSTPRTILSALAASDAVNSVWSGDPSTDHVYAYQVLRAV